jgi:hypothetical protein
VPGDPTVPTYYSGNEYQQCPAANVTSTTPFLWMMPVAAGGPFSRSGHGSQTTVQVHSSAGTNESCGPIALFKGLTNR